MELGKMTQNQIELEKGEFKKCATTEKFVFYGDEEGNVIMYDKQGALLSNNYHAQNALTEVIQDKEYTRLHDDFNPIREQINADTTQ